MGNSMIRFDEINFPSAIRTVLKNLWVVILLCISALLIAVSVVPHPYPGKRDPPGRQSITRRPGDEPQKR